MERITPSRYVQEIVLKHLHTIQHNIPGVRTQAGIEPLHRARVAVRRLRNALWVVRHLFPSEKLQQWVEEIRPFAKVSGAARDLDVCIAYLAVLERRTKHSQEKRFIQTLIAEFRRKRDLLQPKLLRMLKGLERHRTLEHIAEYLRHLPMWFKEGDMDIFVPLACERTHKRLKEMMDFKQYVDIPQKSEELHQMRIAAKHLRYTLETFQPVLGRRRSGYFIKVAQEIQRLLGGLHDYDVWIAICRQHAHCAGERAGAQLLLRRFEALRRRTYGQFKRYWHNCEQRDVFGRLKALLSERDGGQEKKIALVSDVHGNWLALKAVLAHADKKKVDVLWHLGDFLGYGPFPNEVVQELRKRKAVSIVGNYDLKVLDFAKNRKAWQGRKHPSKYFSFAWTHRCLARDNARYLRQLPHEKIVEAGGKKFLFVHGSPAGIDDGLTKTMPLTHFMRLARMVKEDAVLCGHTHGFFTKKAGNVLFINPGSVGRPFDGDPRASYAVIKVSKDGIKVKNYRIRYDVKKTVKFMRAQGFPEELVRSIAEAKSVDELKPKG